MLANQRPAKRQCFSVESLAISSRTESQDLSRDTDSPFLHYIQSKEHEMNNNNVMQFVLNNSYNMNALRHCDNGLDLTRHSLTNNGIYPTLTTSTPITMASKRRRICSSSSSTSPTSSEDERLVTDMSVTSESAEDEKLSISSSTTSSVTSDPDLDAYQDDSMLKRKKARTAFTGEQLRELEKRYKSQKYLSASDRTQLARSLRLKDQQVKTWFQNRRMKEKRQQKEDEQSHGFSLPTGGVDIAQLAALGICPPPYNHLMGTTSPYSNHQTQQPTDPIPSPQGKLEPASSMYNVPAVNTTTSGIPSAHQTDRLVPLLQPTSLISPHFMLPPSSIQHPLMHYGYTPQFSPSLQSGKRS